MQEHVNVVLLQFWVNRWRQTLPYPNVLPPGRERYETRMLHGVEAVLGMVLASGASRWPKHSTFQRGAIAFWRAMWVALEYRRLNAARLDELIRWLDQEPNRYHCFVR